MPLWLTAYCTKTLDELSAGELLQGITGGDMRWLAGVDYDTLAEDYEIDPGMVAPALRQLAVADSSCGFTISFGMARPIEVGVWSEPERVKEEVAEVKRKAIGIGLRRRLARTKCVIGVEFGASNLKDMGVVLAYEAARYLANRGDGLIFTDEGRWLEGRGGLFQPYGP